MAGRSVFAASILAASWAHRRRGLGEATCGLCPHIRVEGAERVLFIVVEKLSGLSAGLLAASGTSPALP